jgi:hypothetical protein
MNGLISIDDLSVISATLQADFALPVDRRKEIAKQRIDEILDLLLMEYIYGNADGNEMLDSAGAFEVDRDRMEQIVNAVIAGKTWRERMEEYYASDVGTADDVIRIIETETHRVYNDSVLDVGERANREQGGVMKTWLTMEDEKVRSEHQYLEGMTVGVNDYFYTYDGHAAKYPGGFGVPELDVNCRCVIWITR